MLSHADVRIRVENALRGIVIAVLVVMSWQSLHQEIGSGGQVVRARSVESRALSKWSMLAKAPSGIHIQLDSVPSPVERAWLGALAGAGSRVTWSGDVPPVMIEAQPVASPTGGTRVFVTAPTGTTVLMSDDIGVIDTIRAQNGGAALMLNSVVDDLEARVKNSVASTTRRDSVVLHKVLVIGEAGWESKFVVAALEEDGWKVDAFIRVAPGVDVTQGSAAVIDTSRYSAVVALDGAASPYASRIVEYARTGGGVVLAPEAARVSAIEALRSGTVGRSTSEARAIQAGGSVTLATLGLAPITALRSDAVPLEKHAGAVAIVARRFGAGRVLQLGYEDTWRWRMSGGEGAVHDHRVWWTELVGSVASAPHVVRPMPPTSTDEAPMSGLVASIGPRNQPGAMSNLSGNPSDWVVSLFVVLTLGLIGEVASRRLRGAS